MLWFFYGGNDLLDLVRGSDHFIVKKYLNDGFRQGVMDRDYVIAKATLAFADGRFAAASNGHAAIDWQDIFRRLLSFYDIRLVLGAQPKSLASAEDSNYSLFRSVLVKAVDAVDAWGGKLVLDHLPSIGDLTQQNETSEKVFAIVQELEIPQINPLDQFRAHPDPQVLFDAGHYSVPGHQLIANTVAAALQQDP